MKRQPWFWPIKRFFKRVAGKELWLKKDVQFETVKTAEWTYIFSELGPESVVYSLGVGDNIDFDLGVIEKFGVHVYAFDPTPYAREWVESRELPKEFVFKPWAAAGEDGTLRLFRRVSKSGSRVSPSLSRHRQATHCDQH